MFKKLVILEIIKFITYDEINLFIIYFFNYYIEYFI